MASLRSRYSECIEPPTPEEPLDSTIVDKCPICGKPIYYDDKDVRIIDGLEVMIHENCMVFKQLSPSEMLDMLGVDYYEVTAKEIFEEGY